jgi:hypothetical protein
MSRIYDFTAGDVSKNSSASTVNCNIVIDSHEKEAHIPKVEYPSVAPTIPITVDRKFEEESLRIKTSILTETQKTNFDKILDINSKIILNATALLSLISIKTNTPIDEITINYEEPEPECCGIKHYDSFVSIQSILIKNLDFRIAYNEIYNEFINKHKISLDKVSLRQN